MDTVVELAFEGLRVFVRLILAALELLIECMRAIARPFFHIVLEVGVDVVAEPCGRGWQRLHRRIGRSTGLPSMLITLLMVIALIAGAFVSIALIGWAIF
jgi:hypothetical protein